MKKDILVIGSRGSRLALCQTNWVKDRLEQLNSNLDIKVTIITTKGDAITDVSLPELGGQGKGLFTRELEEEMLAGRIDLAVHSLKDLPTDLPVGLHIGAIPEREDPRDALIARTGITSFAGLPEGSRIGTSSLRRQSQILAARNDLIMESIRGNVDTRLRKLDEGLFDAIILASAGVRRLGRKERITEYLSADLILPAVGQGALAIECRGEDSKVNEVLGLLDHLETRSACVAERAFLKALGGGCLVPIASYARIVQDHLLIDGLVAAIDGSKIIRSRISGRPSQAVELGSDLAKELLEKGAATILKLK